MPGNFGMIDGVTRVHSLGEMEVIEHPGGLIETASACNRLHWGRGERIGVLLTLAYPAAARRFNHEARRQFRCPC